MIFCLECGAIVTDDENYAETETLERICERCTDRGINPPWAGASDKVRSGKQSANIKAARAKGAAAFG